ncbi:Domain of uncharacterised function (DUF336) [Mycobacteroides abscessus subsp. abscessus]|nr:Domain of uncharacterised function (DUF336) [Mycobacteroides abscessus subsp. abscessus]SIA09095.1 Domain of uncharacterised function (DUF336) [Mycobacteroides abscessus subsp. abscessus]SIA71671.1 Domain of uncharacterised function (DUF336) [Mycobacteroides abscessus subsp. abscessus]SIG05506.1 Domain of uncharacterised function (DUF336) [Mycobacteroides abscessus subsp. abscessus]SIG73817.1 Domain of uncharacterised function (DUF336) [Mycobacteroides abscessus subsp. abscessus]
MPDITLEHANQLVARGLAAAEKAGMKAVFAILDSGANLVAFARMVASSRVVYESRPDQRYRRVVAE